jgi:UDP:flavonoid glycosyltransferase YjiC (YdhE family)
MFADQPTNAPRVAATGAALVVAPDRGATDAMGALTTADVPRLRAAIETMLIDPSHRRAAERIAGEMSAQPSLDELVATLAT